MAKADIKEIYKDISANHSPYAYYQEIIDENFVKAKRGVSKDDILAAFLMNDVTRSDLFILLAIAKYSFATRGMIESFLQVYGSKYPELPIPSIEHIKSRLDTLKNYAYIHHFSFQSKYERSERKHYFCVTANGFAILRRQLAYEQRYDDYLAGTRMDEVCKQLDASFVLSKLYETGKTDFIGTTEIVYNRAISRQRIFAKAKFKNDETSLHILIEPLYSSYDKSVLDTDRYREIMNTRLKTIIEFYQSVKNGGRIPMLIILEESEKQMTNHMKFFSSKYYGMLDDIYFTTTSLVFKYGLKEGLLRINAVDESMAPESIENSISDRHLALMNL